MVSKLSRLLWVVTAFLCLTAVPRVQGQPLVSGSFSWSGVSEQGDEVFVTLSVELFNHSGEDLYDVVLQLADLPDPEGVNELWVGGVASDEPVRTSGQVVVPAALFDAWTKGATPLFFVQFVDGNGGEGQTMTQLPYVPRGEGS